MRMKKIVTTKYVSEGGEGGENNGFEFNFEPVEDSMTITKTEAGYEARYLVRDKDARSPQEDGDEGLFLVGLHRQFYVLPPGVKQGSGKGDRLIIEDAINKYSPTHHVFALEAYIHSGVVLALSGQGRFPDRAWDVSQLGTVFVSKEEWPTRAKARIAALGLIETWNEYLSGDVYGIVKEVYDADKKPVSDDAVWGYYGYKNALAALKTEI